MLGDERVRENRMNNMSNKMTPYVLESHNIKTTEQEWMTYQMEITRLDHVNSLPADDHDYSRFYLFY